MSASVLMINGSPVNLDAAELVLLKLIPFTRGGIPSLTFQRRGGSLTGLPDPYLWKTCGLVINGTTYFNGQVISCHPTFTPALGWVFTYTALGLRDRGDWLPNTDDNSGLDTTPYNVQQDNQARDYIASRAGRTVGQILTGVLTMPTNAAGLNAVGIGAYTTMSPPTLPSATIADLATLTLIPPCPVYVSGEKLLDAVESFLASWAPNHTLWIEPATGTLRVLDQRTYTAHTFTLGTDPVEPTPLSRDVGDSFSRVVVRGQPWTEPVLASLTNGLLAEDFAYGSLTNAQAKAAYTVTDSTQPGQSQDHGTCTCTSTTTIVVTSSDATRTWISDFWDQTSTGRHGWIMLHGSTLAGLVTQSISRPIVANTALSAGGTSTITVSLALPVTSYDTYEIFGFAGDKSIVYRQYSVTNAAIAAAMTSQFMAEVPFSFANNSAAVLTSYPMGSVLSSPTGSPPYNEVTSGFSFDPAGGTILFYQSTFLLAGSKPPHDVKALLAVNKGLNRVAAPVDSMVGSPPVAVPNHEGTCYTVEGIQRTLVVTVDQWRDPANASQLQLYAQDILDSRKDAVVEGEVTYIGLYEPALTPGMAVLVAGNDGSGAYLTGWESSLTSFGGGGIPVVAVELEYDTRGEPYLHRTILHCSNRRCHYTAAAFLRPARTGLEWSPDWNPFGNLIGLSLGEMTATAMAGFNTAFNRSLQETAGAIPEALRNVPGAGRAAEAYAGLGTGLTGLPEGTVPEDVAGGIDTGMGGDFVPDFGGGAMAPPDRPRRGPRRRPSKRRESLRRMPEEVGEGVVGDFGPEPGEGVVGDFGSEPEEWTGPSPEETKAARRVRPRPRPGRPLSRQEALSRMPKEVETGGAVGDFGDPFENARRARAAEHERSRRYEGEAIARLAPTNPVIRQAEADAEMRRGTSPTGGESVVGDIGLGAEPTGE